MQEHLQLLGRRHDVPGHYHKAIGLLRVFSRRQDGLDQAATTPFGFSRSQPLNSKK